MQKKPTGWVFFLLALTHFAFSQAQDTLKIVDHFSGRVSVTHNGISLIPSFSLERPAVTFNLAMGRKKLGFEPELRFALEGKPWTFIFWWRYKLLKTTKLSLNIGANPTLNFKTVTSTENGVFKERIIARRSVAGELSPSYAVDKNIRLGLYYLYARGLDGDIPQNVHFLRLDTHFTHLKLSDKSYMGFNPQVYYLKVDERDGFYTAVVLTLAKKNFPVSVSSILNKKIQTDVVPDKDFIWNVSLVYDF